ncbi:MAG: hypothetical protein AVDCRST_MAG35-2543, partial [uncultured Quadrisphaera sp.]
ESRHLPRAGRPRHRGRPGGRRRPRRGRGGGPRRSHLRHRPEVVPARPPQALPPAASPVRPRVRRGGHRGRRRRHPVPARDARGRREHRALRALLGVHPGPAEPVREPGVPQRGVRRAGGHPPRHRRDQHLRAARLPLLRRGGPAGAPGHRRPRHRRVRHPAGRHRGGPRRRADRPDLRAAGGAARRQRGLGRPERVAPGAGRRRRRVGHGRRRRPPRRRLPGARDPRRHPRGPWRGRRHRGRGAARGVGAGRAHPAPRGHRRPVRRHPRRRDVLDRLLGDALPGAEREGRLPPHPPARAGRRGAAGQRQLRRRVADHGGARARPAGPQPRGHGRRPRQQVRAPAL